MGETHQEVTQGDEDYQGERVQIRQDVVWDSVSGHGGSLGRQVVVDLVICQP